MLSISFLFEDNIDVLIKQIDRADFLDPDLKDRAYDNTPLPIKHEQTTSAPSLVKDVLRNLGLNKSMTVFEIGTGSGWQTVLMAKLSKHVFSIEINPDIRDFAEQNIKKYNIRNVTLRLGNGLYGWQDNAPFDRIVISAALKKVPNVLLDQLTPEGFIIAPIEKGLRQILTKIYKDGGYKELSDVRFVKIKRR